MTEREQTVVTIGRDGSIKAKTLGIKGKACVDYLPLLEDLLDAEVVDSAFTPEYTEVDQEVVEPAPETVREQEA